ncbi:cleft lip and palate transmembrane 1 [Backusella circina FSU 941]|nr:cleft lip and palate transmembrane 1 [Backusella circina FSU 941]
MPLWKRDTLMQLSVYISPDIEFSDYDAKPAWKISFDQIERLLQQKAIEIPVEKNTQQLYAHIFLARESSPIDPHHSAFSVDSVVYIRHSLMMMDAMKRVYWHDKLTVNFIYDTNDYIKKNTLHPITLNYIIETQHHLQNQQHFNKRIVFYRPILFLNDFWSSNQDIYLVNETTSRLPLTIHLESLSLWKFNVYATLTKLQPDRSYYRIAPETKQMLLDMDPSYMLSFTLITSCLYALFEFLAFKNDVTFWKNKHDRIGISLHSMIINLVFQLIIFLASFDLQDSNMMREVIQGCQLLIECWKLAILYQIPNNHKTKELDNVALHYLCCMSFLCLFGFYYYQQKSSLQFLVEFISLFGFLVIIAPQIYINYHLGTVAHSPPRTLVYKSLNMLIDNIFAIIIKMPLVQRISSSRSSVIFLVYLCQQTTLFIKRHLQGGKRRKA